MMESQVIVSCDYDAPNPDTYRGLLVHIDNRLAERFFSDNPAIDIERVNEWLVHKGHEAYTCASSFRSYISDVEKRLEQSASIWRSSGVN